MTQRKLRVFEFIIAGEKHNTENAELKLTQSRYTKVSFSHFIVCKNKIVRKKRPMCLPSLGPVFAHKMRSITNHEPSLGLNFFQTRIKIHHVCICACTCVSIPLSPGDSRRSTKHTCYCTRAISSFLVPSADGAPGFPLLLLRPQPPSAPSSPAGRCHMSPATLTRPTHTSLSAGRRDHLSHLFVRLCGLFVFLFVCFLYYYRHF